MTQTIFISGATSFISQHIIKLLLEKEYNVIGSVRTAAKGDHLVKLFGSKFTYEVVPDVEPKGAFDEALEKHPEVSVFLHVASPFHFKATNPEEELLKPAVNGTNNALSAIQKHGKNVKKVVVTSSYAAISTAGLETDKNHVNNEDSWNAITWEEATKDPVNGYRGSKKFAEKTAWDFVENERPQFTINFVNPSFVFGPQAFDSELKDSLNTSSEILNAFLKMSPESDVPATRGGYVDVRDVAKAHVVAFEKEFTNQRLLLNAGRFASQDILDILNDKFESLRGKIPEGVKGSGKEINDSLCTIDNKKTLELLGFPLIDLEKTVYDSIKQILDVKKST